MVAYAVQVSLSNDTIFKAFYGADSTVPYALLNSALLNGSQEYLQNTKCNDTSNTIDGQPNIDSRYGKKIKDVALIVVKKMELYQKILLYKTV